MNPRYLTIASFAVALSASAQTIILQDDFNTADNTDINAGIARQTGTQATQIWNVFGATGSPNADIVGNQLFIEGTSLETNVESNLDFGSIPALTSNGAFTVSFDILSIANTFTGFAFNGAQTQTRPVVDDTTDFGILLLGPGHAAAGEISVREGENEVSRATPAFGLTGSIVLNITTSAITTGNGFTVDMTINGNTVDLNGATAGSTFGGNWASDSLYMSLNSLASSTSPDTLVDNFTVSTIPEPSTYALALAGAALGLVVIRRRRK